MLGKFSQKVLTVASALVGALLFSGCMHPAQHAFRSYFACRDGSKVARTNDGYYRVNGCGQAAVYECRYGKCWRAISSAPMVASPAPATPSSDKRDVVHKERRAEGYQVFKVDLYPWNKGFGVVAGAAPERAKDFVILSFQISKQKYRDGEPAECDIRLLVDLERVALEEPVRKDKELVRVWELRVPVATALALVRSKQAAWRVCGGTWEMNDEARERLAGLLARQREALAWDETPRTIGKVARAPEGGWPAWSKALPAAPAPDASGTFDGVALHERLKGSVYPVHVQSGQSEGLGSAVAISKTTLLTNCHVVEGATKVTVGHTGSELRAKILKSHPETDRCVLEVTGGEVSPVAHVRSQKDLKIGERAFTIGSPAGLESTLGEGIVSGLREEEGLHFVQTSAPISPGSSGGGLFDQHGNLIGITTFINVGAERVNQALNFAIAADEFFND